MVRTSAFGWVARTVLINGSSTGFMVLARCAPTLASLRRTPAWLGEAVAAGAATAGGPPPPPPAGPPARGERGDAAGAAPAPPLPLPAPGPGRVPGRPPPPAGERPT